MKKKQIILIIIGFILTVAITVTLTLIFTKEKEEHKLNRVNINEQETKKEEIKKEEEIIPDIIENEEKQDNLENKNEVITKPNKKEEINNNINNDTNNVQIKNEEEITLPENNIEQPKSEADIISYVEEIPKSNAADKLKNGFVTVIDFIFYDGEISGKTFAELSSSAKLKIIIAALKIDAKIEEYFPEYKEKISATSTKVYTNVKSKLITLYLDTTVKICNSNPTLCIDAKAGLQDLKDNFGLTWSFIKDISGVGITKLKNWYEVWKEE